MHIRNKQLFTVKDKPNHLELNCQEYLSTAYKMYPNLYSRNFWAQFSETSFSLSLTVASVWWIKRVHVYRTTVYTGINPAGDAGDTSPNILVRGDVNGNTLPQYYYVLSVIADRYWLPSVRSASFGYKTPPIRYSQAGGQSAHKARPPNLQLALTTLTV